MLNLGVSLGTGGSAGGGGVASGGTVGGLAGTGAGAGFPTGRKGGSGLGAGGVTNSRGVGSSPSEGGGRSAFFPSLESDSAAAEGGIAGTDGTAGDVDSSLTSFGSVFLPSVTSGAMGGAATIMSGGGFSVNSAGFTPCL